MTRTNNNSNASLSVWKRMFNQLQRIGKSLLYPIAMLPFAAIFLRLGAAIPGGDTAPAFAQFISGLFLGIGSAVFDNLAILFAVGIAFGLSKDNRGEAAIVGLVAMILLNILMTDGGQFGGKDFVDKIYHKMTLNGGHGFHGLYGGKYNAILGQNVFTGIFAGSIVAYIYNRYNGIELPSILGFFSGRRLVPVLVLMATVLLGLVYALIFPWLGAGLYYIGKGMGEAQGNHWANAGVMGIYGFVNRLLIPFGLHHVINIPLWFSGVGGEFAGVSGDINIFAQAPASVVENGVTMVNPAGTFQTGFFPAMMFGLPAIAAAIYYNAQGNVQKQRVASLFAGSALVSFFTGITEPIEFAFMFLAPSLYMLHAVLTGLSAFIVGVFGMQIGFGFSAGLIDYVLSIPKSMDIANAKGGFEGAMSNPAWMWVVGAGTAAAYFFSANFMIKKMNLSTPGRGANLIGDDASDESDLSVTKGGTTLRAAKYVKALGGYSNITMYSHCATRLRYDVKDMDKVDEKALKSAGAFGSKKVSAHHIHVVVGPNVEIVNNEIVAGMPSASKAKVVSETVPS
ncbi:MAG: PTS transporter subunit EIIC [Mycoplasmatales bacterium]|nr:PTS transporter subunit EIIC [Mycoplasmatales bacterium]